MTFHSKPTVVFDFDGVVHSYKSGWCGPENIPDEPVEGIREAIADVREHYRVVIVSTRCVYEGGEAAIWDWLYEHNIIVDDVCKEKPPAIVYIDDRAICFDGKPERLLNLIQNFKPWNR